jgi:dihydrolipoamide dehydrogenase
MADSNYDLVVIGAGPGGYQASIRAAQLGMRVACIEKDATLGGTCLNVGCIPSKALLESTHRYHVARHGLEEHGIHVGGEVSVDLTAMMSRKSAIVGGLTKGIEGLFKKHKITWLRGTGRIASANEVRVSGETSDTISAGRILIATGSIATELPTLRFDGKRVLSSTEALSLTAVPKRIVVVGAGAIGLEMGSVWARLGTEVVVVELTDQVVPGADKEAARALHRALSQQGLDIRLQTTVDNAKPSDRGVSVTLAGKTRVTEECDFVLVAVGRRAYTGSLGTEEAGIQTDERGRIVVEGHYETSLRGVHAIGDVIAGPMLAHKAEEEGVAAVERMAGVAGHVNYDAIPSVVYTHPELASVGMSEEAAKKAGIAIRTGKFPFKANARARCNGETDGFAKVIAESETDRVLGIHIVGAGASELIAEAALAMEYVASSEDIARSVHAHPTLAEALKEAALAVDGRTLNI